MVDLDRGGKVALDQQTVRLDGAQEGVEAGGAAGDDRSEGKEGVWMGCVEGGPRSGPFPASLSRDRLTFLDLLGRFWTATERVQAYMQLCPALTLLLLEPLEHVDCLLGRPHRMQTDVSPVADRDVDLCVDDADLVRDRSCEVGMPRVGLVCCNVRRVRDPEGLVEADFADLAGGKSLETEGELRDEGID